VIKGWRLAPVGVVVALGLWFGSVGVAWGDQPIAMCTVPPNSQNTHQCGTADVSSAGWYGNPVFVSWHWNTGSATGGCQSQLLSQNQNWSGLPVSELPTSLYCDTTGGTGSYRIQIEISNPTASAGTSRPPDSNGWYNHPVSVVFGGRAFSGIAFCTTPITYAGPDRSTAEVGGRCVDNAGKAAGAGIPLHYDATPPAITSAKPTRPPDHHGWYNHPVAFAFGGADATSGISSCSHVTYAGPNSASGAVTGGCRDRAGNVALTSVPLHYDAAGPSVGLSASTGDRLVSLHWQVGGDVAPMSSLKVSRKPGLRGDTSSVVYHGSASGFRDRHVRNGQRYRYTVTVHDQAGNTTVRTIERSPGPHLLSPGRGAALSAPPMLSWTSVHHATYYNVQLFRAGKKILSVWPTRTSLQLSATWAFAHHHYRLRPGHYRWYVWPGFGKRSAGRYGKRIGRGTFTIAAT
jgi:hypothetical protein